MIENLIYSVFKCLVSRGFHVNFLFLFSKQSEYCNTGATYILANIFGFFEQRSLDHFHEYKMSIRLYSKKKTHSLCV